MESLYIVLILPLVWANSKDLKIIIISNNSAEKKGFSIYIGQIQDGFMFVTYENTDVLANCRSGSNESYRIDPLNGGKLLRDIINQNTYI